MLIIVIVSCKWMTFFVRTFPSYEHLAACLLFKSFLVNSFWADNQANEIYTLVLRQIYFGSKLLILS